MRTAMVMYIIWSLFLVGSGIYIYRAMMSTSNPSSLNSRFQDLKEAMENENP